MIIDLKQLSEHYHVHYDEVDKVLTIEPSRRGVTFTSGKEVANRFGLPMKAACLVADTINETAFREVIFASLKVLSIASERVLEERDYEMD